eukprot:760651-Hanusia_phi.AAC.1
MARRLTKSLRALAKLESRPQTGPGGLRAVARPDRTVALRVIGLSHTGRPRPRRPSDPSGPRPGAGARSAGTARYHCVVQYGTVP